MTKYILHFGTGVRNSMNTAPEVCRSVCSKDCMMAFFGANCHEYTQVYMLRFSVTKISVNAVTEDRLGPHNNMSVSV